MLPMLTLERDLDPASPAVRISGWAKWRVVDEAGGLVGFVVEEREWLGHTYGPATFTAVHNPTGEDFGALWRAEGLASPAEALGALVSYLEGG